MAQTPTASTRSIIAVAMLLGGGVAAVLGAVVAVLSVPLVVSGDEIGHSAALVTLAVALCIAAVGAWAVKIGRRMYRDIERTAVASTHAS